jgi:hypothetical protein
MCSAGHPCITNGLYRAEENEDRSRVRKQNAPQNIAVVRHFVINMLNHAKATMKGIGLKGLRKKAGWCNATLSSILRRNF